MAKFEETEVIRQLRSSYLRHGFIGWHDDDGVCYFMVECSNSVGLVASHFRLMFESMDEALDCARKEQEALGYWPTTYLERGLEQQVTWQRGLMPQTYTQVMSTV